MRKCQRAQSQEWRDEKNDDINQFYSALQEVIDELAKSNGVMEAMNERFKDATVTEDNLREYLLKLKVEALERMDTKMTKEEREALYQLMLAAWKLGGDESARLLWLGQELEDLDYDYTQLVPGAVMDEYNYFMGKKKYSGENGCELLKKNMISRVEGCTLGGDESGRLLTLAIAMEEFDFDHTKLTPGFVLDEYTHFITKDTYSGDADLLKANMISRLEGSRVGGAESGRLIVLALALEDVCFMPEKLEGIAEEEYRHFMGKDTYNGDDGIESLLKNAKSRLFGSRLGGKASADLLRLGQGMNEDYTFDSDEMENEFNDLLVSKYDNNRSRLVEVIKNRTNGWFICRGVQELRLAFQSTASMLPVNPKDIISDKVLSNIGTVNEQLFNKIKDMNLVGESECIGKDRLYDMLNGGWAYFLNLPKVLSTFITFAKNNQIELDATFTESTYKAMGQNLKDIVDACAGMTLNSTGNKEIGRQLLYEKLTNYHQAQHSSEAILKQHISKCKRLMKWNSSKDEWYLECKGNKVTYNYLFIIRDLEHGDYNYWKVQAFSDAGVDLSKWKQTINQDMINERKIEARQGIHEASEEVLGEEEDVEVEEVVAADGLDY